MRDLIRREDAIDAVLELNTDGRVSWKDAVIDMLDALPSATCDDCIWHVCNYNKIDWDGEDGYISRQDAVSEIDEWIQMATGNGTDMAIKDFLSFLKERIESLPSAEPKTGKCETCKRNADNGGFYDDGRTRCPIQEHYALLKDGYCHLYEPRMRGEEE